MSEWIRKAWHCYWKWPSHALPHCPLFAEPEDDRKVVAMPKSREMREAEMTRFLRWFGFWWTLGWIAGVVLALAWLSTRGGQ